MDDKAHNASTVFSILQQFLPLLKSNLPHIRHVTYLTDSPTSQYRNATITTMLVKHEALFHIRANWIYFESGHGKGPCKGIGGTSKRRADEALKRGVVASIENANDFYQWAKCGSTSIQYFLVKGSDVAAAQVTINSWVQVCVPNIMKVHSVRVCGPHIYSRDRACFYPCCYNVESNTFIGECPGWLKTSAQRQTVTRGAPVKTSRGRRIGRRI